MINDIQQQVRDILDQYLKSHKLRRTPERYALLEEIYQQERHFKADELHQTMLQKFRVSRATVYNSLDLFVHLGLVMRTLVDNVVEYEKCYGRKIHYHMICSVCGSVKEFTDPRIALSVNTAKYSRFTPQSYSLNVYGICNKCRRKIEKTNKQQK